MVTRAVWPTAAGYRCHEVSASQSLPLICCRFILIYFIVCIRARSKSLRGQRGACGRHQRIRGPVTSGLTTRVRSFTGGSAPKRPGDRQHGCWCPGGVSSILAPNDADDDADDDDAGVQGQQQDGPATCTSSTRVHGLARQGSARRSRGRMRFASRLTGHQAAARSRARTRGSMFAKAVKRLGFG